MPAHAAVWSPVLRPEVCADGFAHPLSLSLTWHSPHPSLAPRAETLTVRRACTAATARGAGLCAALRTTSARCAVGAPWGWRPCLWARVGMQCMLPASAQHPVLWQTTAQVDRTIVVE